MAKYRKKPVVVEAEQFLPDKRPWPVGVFEGPCLCRSLAQDGDRCRIHKELNFIKPYYQVLTIHGLVDIEPGCWVIPEIRPGRAYPVTPDIFQATYELVDGEDKVSTSAKRKGRGVND